MRDILDSHTHTIASGHAYSTMHEMVRAAADRGLELIGITEHAPAMPGTCHEYYFLNMKTLPRRMYGVEVLHGAEANILDLEGKLDMSEYLLGLMDVVIASMHVPCLRAGSASENTRAAIRALEHPCVTILGHPDDSRFPLNYDEVARGARENGVLIEINNSSLHPKSSRQNAIANDVHLLRACEKYGTPVILSSDAHIQEEVGNHAFAKILLETMNFPEELVVNRSASEFKKYCNRKN